MSDDEQFSLSWNNFNSNLSAGLHESLCREDLVDVTLAAEGQFIKAHRLVLSVCSPYFRKMFTQMPTNQHAFVFLKDVSHTVLKDLIHFMYCGEVNVEHDALAAFISTAKALQIKGLTDGDKGAQIVIQAQVHTSQQQQQTQQHQAQVQIQPQQVTPQKRVAQKSITAHAVKRTKIVQGDSIEASEQTQITVQTVSNSKASQEPEFIDQPIELSTKSEPENAEDAGGVESIKQETTYVENDSYGDMKYDESYCTEYNETSGTSNFEATLSSLKQQQPSISESYVGDAVDPSRTETEEPVFGTSQRGRLAIYRDGYKFSQHAKNKKRTVFYWHCTERVKSKCKARLITVRSRGKHFIKLCDEIQHSHPRNNI